MNEQKTHWRKVLESDHLAGADLDNGKGGFDEIVLTIGQAKRETVKDKDGKDENCLVLHWQENAKPMILNVTNTKTIVKLTGSNYLEDWSGLRVAIGTQKVKAFGDVWDALRIRPKRLGAQQAGRIECADCHKPVPDHEGVLGRTIAEAYKGKYGVPLCFECGQARKAAGE